MFNSQMVRIYKKELENLVMSYEAYIQAIYSQIEKRKAQQEEEEAVHLV